VLSVLLILWISTNLRCPVESISREKYKKETVNDVSRISIVVPFIEQQISRVLENLDLWNDYPPCLWTSTEPRGYELFLIFYVSRPWNESPDLMQALNQIRALINENNAISKCVDHVMFLSAQLSPEEDIRDNVSGAMNTQGPNLMFYRIFSKLKPLNIAYMLWYEPDVIPVQLYWMDKLNLIIASKLNDDFLIAGSYQVVSENLRMHDMWIMYKDIPRWTVARMHINGCALYHLLPELDQLISASIQAYGTTMPFDMAIYMYLTAGENWLKTQHIFYRYRYDMFIQNRHSDLLTISQLQTLLPTTLLIHHPWCAPPMNCTGISGRNGALLDPISLRRLYSQQSYFKEVSE
jgi:hypothetical protein